MNNELNNVNAFQCKVCMVWLSVWQFDPWSWFCVKFGDHVQENRGSIKIRWAPFILEITISSRANKRHVNICWQIWQTSLKMPDMPTAKNKHPTKIVKPWALNALNFEHHVEVFICSLSRVSNNFKKYLFHLDPKHPTKELQIFGFHRFNIL